MSNSDKNILEALNKKNYIILFFATGIVLFALSGWMWWRNIYTSPERVFWGMVNTSLSTTGVNKHTEQDSNGAALVQDTQINLGANNQSHSIATIVQKGAQGDTKVTTETIGTLGADYARYTNIEIPGASDEAKKNLQDVLNKWGKNEAQDKEQTGRFLAQSVLNLGSNQPGIPFGYLSGSDREALIKQMKEKKVYDVDFNLPPTRKVENGQNVYVYKVKIKVGPYVGLLQEYGNKIGLGDIGLDANNYQDTPDISAEFAVNPVNRQLVAINYPDQNFKEVYSSYGAQTAVALPTSVVPISELQSKIQNL